MPTLQFLGANRQVTGSCYLLSVGDRRIMIDCGMYQERALLERNWNPFPVPPESVDCVLLTHAHLDHCGLLPKLCAEGFAGKVLCTRPTFDLSAIVLEDSAHIQQEDIEHKRRRHEREGRTGPYPLRPLYTREDVEACLGHWKPVNYEESIDLADGVRVRYRDAGHILGSAIVEVTFERGDAATTIVFSGDLGQWASALVQNPAMIPAADYVVMESTYGDRNHDGEASDVENNLARLINDAAERGGNLLIPTFAIDRAQDLLYYIGRLVEQKRIPKLGIYLDSPMAIDATTIYKRYPDLFDAKTREMFKRGDHPFQFSGLNFVRSPAESQRLNTLKGPRIILAGSGMCTGGRIKHHLRHNLERRESTILFVGYQAAGTLGREIVDGAREVRIHGEFYRVSARVERLFGLSAHADRQDLMRWLGYYRRPPKRLFLTHGDAEAAESLSAHVQAELGWDVTVPSYRDAVELD